MSVLVAVEVRDVDSRVEEFLNLRRGLAFDIGGRNLASRGRQGKLPQLAIELRFCGSINQRWNVAGWAEGFAVEQNDVAPDAERSLAVGF